MFTFDEDELVDCIAGALLMAVGVDPGSSLGEMHPNDWVPIARDVAHDIRDQFKGRAITLFHGAGKNYEELEIDVTGV